MLLLAVQAFVLGIAAVFCFTKERKTPDVDVAEWQAWLIAYDESEEAWYIDETVYKDKSAADMIYGPYIDLERGSYVITVYYDADSNNSCVATASGIDGRGCLRGDEVTLDAKSHVKEFRIELTDDVDNFGVTVRYHGKGYLKIQNIVISESKSYDIRRIFCLFGVFLLLDMLLVFSDFIKTHRRELLLLLGILFLATLPELIADYYSGHDIHFHLLRIEGIARELRLGNFPAKLHSLALNGYGYPVSVYYGDVFLYLPALLRLLGFSVIGAYKIYIFFINAGTVFLSYRCFLEIFRKQEIALIGTLAYVTCPYRLLDIYERAAVGEYAAMMAFPLLALAFYRIYTAEDVKNGETYKRNALPLTAGMTILLSSHILSTEMAVFVLFIICVVFLKKTFRKNTLKVYVTAVCATVLLNAYFLVPFLDYYRNGDVNITNKVQHEVMTIQSGGAYIGQYFAFFEGMRGGVSNSIVGRMQLTPGPVLMAALAAAIYLLLMGRANKRCLFHVVSAVLLLFLASNLFPWDYLAKRSGIFNALAQVQFPWRYLGIAAIFLTLLLCELLLWLGKEDVAKQKKLCMLAAGTCILMTCYIAGDLFGSVELIQDEGVSGLMQNYDTPGLSTLYTGTEYLRTGTDTGRLEGEIYAENAAVTEIRKSGSQMLLQCETGGEAAYIEVPFFNYPGYHVWDESGREYAIADGENNVIAFSLPADFKGNITVRFKEPLSWRIAEVVSLISLLGLLTVSILSERRNRMYGYEEPVPQRGK